MIKKLLIDINLELIQLCIRIDLFTSQRTIFCCIIKKICSLIFYFCYFIIKLLIYLDFSMNDHKFACIMKLIQFFYMIYNANFSCWSKK